MRPRNFPVLKPEQARLVVGRHYHQAKLQRVTRGENRRGKSDKMRRGSLWQSQYSEKEILKNHGFLSRIFWLLFWAGAKKKLAAGAAKQTSYRQYVKKEKNKE
ncbi:MAG: hypothetical protein IJF15_00865 [Oscillospiraceae bacterium]|nr:hypothetical protein [Oscillospiraceae bacterium]